MATTQELEIMQLIANAGESKTKAFEALAAVKTQDFDLARSLLAESVSLLMVHAQDHYMTSQLARDLIETLIEVFETRA